MEKYYCFAGVELAIRIPREQMYDDDRELGLFEVAEVKDPHVFEVEVVKELTQPQGEEIVAFPGFRVFRTENGTVRYIGIVEDSWKNAYIRAAHNEKYHLVQLKASQFSGKIGIKTVLNSLEAEHLVLENNGIVFHSAFIEWEGKGILFTAPSGTGKTTQAELWNTLRGAGIINGDRSVIRIWENQVYAAGIPFCGSSRYCENKTLPLAAVVYLEQASTTSIHRLRGLQAFCRIWEGISVNTWDKHDLQAAMNLVEQIAAKVPVFHMPCTPDESAVTALEQVLRKQE